MTLVTNIFTLFNLDGSVHSIINFDGFLNVSFESTRINKQGTLHTTAICYIQRNIFINYNKDNITELPYHTKQITAFLNCDNKSLVHNPNEEKYKKEKERKKYANDKRIRRNEKRKAERKKLEEEAERKKIEEKHVDLSEEEEEEEEEWTARNLLISRKWVWGDGNFEEENNLKKEIIKELEKLDEHEKIFFQAENNFKKVLTDEFDNEVNTRYPGEDYDTIPGDTSKGKERWLIKTHKVVKKLTNLNKLSPYNTILLTEAKDKLEKALISVDNKYQCASDEKELCVGLLNVKDAIYCLDKVIYNIRIKQILYMEQEQVKKNILNTIGLKYNQNYIYIGK